MLRLYAGCKTKVPGGKDMYFNLEFEAEHYPNKDKREQLKYFLNDNTSEIVDEVTHLIDATTSELIWEVE